MHTIRYVRERAKADLRRRIYEKGLFRPGRMETLAHRLARAYAAGLSEGDLLAIARHDSWLEARQCENTERIADKLFHYLRRELRRLTQRFWDGHVSVELAVKASEVRLVGFFNGERPDFHINTTYVEGTPQNRQAPYA